MLFRSKTFLKVSDRIDYSNGYLRIENIKEEDAGEYSCKAENAAGWDQTKPIQLKVNSKYYIKSTT